MKFPELPSLRSMPVWAQFGLSVLAVVGVAVAEYLEYSERSKRANDTKTIDGVYEVVKGPRKRRRAKSDRAG